MITTTPVNHIVFSRVVLVTQKKAQETLSGNAYVHAAHIWHLSSIRFRGAIYHETHGQT